MNFNKDLFKETEAKEFGDFETLELGGHEIVILDAREYTSDISGNTSLRISIDISNKKTQEKQAGYFRKQYDSNNDPEKKWPNGAVKYLSLKDEQIAYLKGFITACEKSNSGFKFNMNGNWDQLKGLILAGQFGLEEFKDSEGKIKTVTKLTQFRSIEKLKDIQIPKVKLLDGKFVDYDDYKEFYQDKKDEITTGGIEINDSDLPF